MKNEIKELEFRIKMKNIDADAYTKEISILNDTVNQLHANSFLRINYVHLN